MRTLDATLLAAMDTGNYDPYFLATIQDVYNGNVICSLANRPDMSCPIWSWCSPCRCPASWMCLSTARRLCSPVGVTIAGLHYTLSTSKFTIINSHLGW